VDISGNIHAEIHSSCPIRRKIRNSGEKNLNLNFFILVGVEKDFVCVCMKNWMICQKWHSTFFSLSLSLLPPLPNFSRMSQRQDDDHPGEYEVNNNNVSVWIGVFLGRKWKICLVVFLFLFFLFKFKCTSGFVISRVSCVGASDNGWDAVLSLGPCCLLVVCRGSFFFFSALLRTRPLFVCVAPVASLSLGR
jgi:hypothetical protein